MARRANGLTPDLLLEDLRRGAFAPSDTPDRVGLEVEQLAFQGIQTATLDRILEALDPLVIRGELQRLATPGKPPMLAHGPLTLTFEPGGQLELVTPPRESAVQAVYDVQQLESILDGAFAWHGIRRANHGMTPWQSVSDIPLQTPLPRYQAMHDYFMAIGENGARMMRLSCALQINLDFGPGEVAGRRWRLANLMSPVLIGIFANSPMSEGRVTGWKSTRAQVVAEMDPSRTGPVLGTNGPADYLDFALDARVLLRRSAEGYIPGDPTVTFRHWLEHPVVGERPSLEDWHYHLTTLWPMVRPRGFLELRSMDTAPVRWRSVPVTLVSTLLLDAGARDQATALLEQHSSELPSLGLRAARYGLTDPLVGELATGLMEIARRATPLLPVGWLDTNMIQELGEFNAQYTQQRRCPADDLLDLHRPELEAARKTLSCL